MGPTTTLELTADEDPTLLVRVCALLCTFGLIPNRFTATRLINDLLRISIELSDARDRDIDLLRRKLMQLPQYVHIGLKRNQASDAPSNIPSDREEESSFPATPRDLLL